MDIEKYISNKKNVRVLKLVDDSDFLKELDSCTYESIDSLDSYEKNVFSDDELVVILSDLDSVSSTFSIFQIEFTVKSRDIMKMMKKTLKIISSIIQKL